MTTFKSDLLLFIALLIGIGNSKEHLSRTSTNILVYGAVGSHSTRISMFPFMEALADKGFNVTFVSPFDNFEDPNKRSKIHYYTPEKWKQSMGDWEDHMKFFDVRKAGISPQMWFGFQDVGTKCCEILYSDPEFVNWVKTAKFDLVIAESAVNECAYGLVHLFKSKLVIYGTSTVFPWFSDAFGFPDESSTVPDVSFDFPPRDGGMSFVERIKNALTPIWFALNREYVYFPTLEKITRNGLGLTKDQLPSFREIEQNVSLVLLSTHATIDHPRSLPPHVIPIGGAVASGKVEKPLTPEMTKFLDSADDSDGFVYISFGTVAEFTNFDREVQLEFIQALYSFPKLKFLWKASIKINETLPENVLLVKWAPQQTVLGHPKVKAFISHSGMGSISEAVHFGVPLVLLPVLAEQDANANVMTSRGVGIKLEITTLKKHQLEHALSQILYTDTYRTKMSQLSKAFRDRPSKPVETGVWWVEYILRHPNSNDYLVPLSIRQTWWKRRQVDVWITLGAALVVVTSLCLSIAYFVTKTILTKFVLSTPTRKSAAGKVKAN